MDDDFDFDFLTSERTPNEIAKSENNKGRYYNVAEEVVAFMGTAPDVLSSTDPTFLNDAKVSGFKLFFHFDAKQGLFADEEYVNSALGYLKRIGQKDRYNKLKSFRTLLSIINSGTPWMFQKIETGMKEIWENNFSNVLTNQIVKISTLETIDDKMTGLMMLYRDIVFDHNRGVWVLPMNLREFSMSIYVYDFRPVAMGSVGASFLNTAENREISKINHVLFDLGFCEFQGVSGSEIFENVSNSAISFAESSLTILAKKSSISGLQKTLFGEIYEDGNETGEEFLSGALTKTEKSVLPKDLKDVTQWKDKLKEDLIDKYNSNEWRKLGQEKYEFLKNPETWKRELGNVYETSLNKAENLVNNQIAKLYMGNVAGFSINDLIKYGDTKSVANEIKQTIKKHSQNASLALDDDHIQKPGALGSSIGSNDISQYLDDDNIQNPGALGNIN